MNARYNVKCRQPHVCMGVHVKENHSVHNKVGEFGFVEGKVHTTILNVLNQIHWLLSIGVCTTYRASKQANKENE